MTSADKILELQQQIIANNTELLKLLNSMNAELYNEYLPKVKKIIFHTGEPSKEQKESLNESNRMKFKFEQK